MEPEVTISSPTELILVSGLVMLAFFLLLEMLVPRRQLAQSVGWRWLNNFSLSLITRYITGVASAVLVIGLSYYTEIRQIGLFQAYPVPAAVAFLALLALTQLCSYWIHVAFHHLPWLWSIHAVHHSDTDLDVSSSYRHHPLEPLVSLPLMTPLVLLLGVPVDAALAYKLFEIGATFFSHSNVRIPEWADKYLRWVILTPDYHRLHHCSEQRYTNSNYGSLVPWFDYVFRTARTRGFREQEVMELGLEYCRESRDTRLDRLILQPLAVARGHVRDCD